MRSRRYRFALSGLAAILIACATPSVPIPPPEPERMAFELAPEDGTARFRYQPDPSYALAVVYVFNRASGEGIITTAEADGSVAPTAPFPAEVGDPIVVTFELDEFLASTCVTLQEGQSSSALECDF